MQENKMAEHLGSQPELKRVMGPGLLLLFIVGDILGTGIYALTGQVAAEVGGVVWLPFLVAFIVALLTAFSYLELVTKYPRAAGAALCDVSRGLCCHVLRRHLGGHSLAGFCGQFRRLHRL
jgi:basic amino acid/polyamine antiporter, APA family